MIQSYSMRNKTNEIVKQLTLRTGRLLQASLFWHCRKERVRRHRVGTVASVASERGRGGVWWRLWLCWWGDGPNGSNGTGAEGGGWWRRFGDRRGETEAAARGGEAMKPWWGLKGGV